MSRATVAGPRAERRGGLLAWELGRVMDYIDMHLEEKIAARDLAGLINVSVGHLFRAFKTSVGVSPLRYVTTRRVELVCTLLMTTHEPICQLALACGLSDQAHLCKVFRRTVGMSPSAWRSAMTARHATCGRENLEVMRQ